MGERTIHQIIDPASMNRRGGWLQLFSDTPPEPKQPFAVFPDSDAFNARMDREANTRLKERARAEGFDSPDALIEAARKYKTEFPQAEAKYKDLEGKHSTLLTENQEIILESTVVREGVALGIVDTDAALKLVDRSGIKFEGRKATGVKEALESLLKDKPYLKGTATPNQGGGSFDGNTPPDLYTAEQLKALKPQEINANWDKVQRSLAALKK